MVGITLYKARKIYTMNRRQPVVDHVAVRDGWILGAGSLDELSGWGDYTLERRFEDKVLLPGFVEGHCHSWEGAAWKDIYVGYLDRTSPTREVHGGSKSIDAVVAKLVAAEQAAADRAKPVRGWGLDPIFLERRMDCADLDRVATDRPVVVFHQSGHIINVNRFVLAKAGIGRDTDVDGLVRDERGEPTGELQGIALYEAALKAVGVEGIVELGEGGEQSMRWFAQSALIAGVTTATDLASGLGPEMVAVQTKLARDPDYPLRVVPAFLGQLGPVEESVAKIVALKAQSTAKYRLGLVKLVIDGSIQGFTARLKAPGYYNGAANGLWYVEPADLPRVLGAFHAAGLQVHIHTNGDQAVEVALDAIEAVLAQRPGPDARFTLQHCQMAHDAHFRRMARLGVCANLFANHIYYWGDQHYAITMGPERAERINAAATAERLGVRYAIHSDAPVTHLAPLFTAWCAVNRQCQSGRILGPNECITVDQALYAITLGAAFTLKLDTELGSIECGKRADFTVLEEDPLAVAPDALKDIGVWGTVVDGRPFAAADIPH